MRTLNAFVNGVALKKDKLVYCKTHVRPNPVRLQLQVDCETTVNFIPRNRIGDTQLEPSNIFLEMRNKEKMKALGSCKLPLENPKTSQKYMVKFIVFEEDLTPCLVARQLKGWNLSKLITLSLKVSVEWLNTSTITYKIFLICPVEILALYLALCN